ncbi:MAG TPA: hypothetical protein PLQ61_03325 [Bacteroidales bacterium]|nr:hypothetical protein [Bacteroidales bacterium]HQJ20212.1 hypothetical protein [Bacteroidales bacterium]
MTIGQLGVMVGSFSIILTVITSCSDKNKEYTHYFDKYSYFDGMQTRNSIIQKYKVINKNEYRFSVIGEYNDYWYYEELNERVGPNGLSRKFYDKYLITHKFDSVWKENSFSGYNRPFFMNTVTLSGIKNIHVKGEEYSILRYYENEGTYGYVSYYLKGFGFISYDMNKFYLLCRRTYNDYRIDEEVLNAVCDSLVRDTSFFSIHKRIEYLKDLEKDIKNLK